MILHAIRCDKCYAQVGWDVRQNTRMELMDNLQNKCGWALGLRDAAFPLAKEITQPFDLCGSCHNGYKKWKREIEFTRENFSPEGCIIWK